MLNLYAMRDGILFSPDVDGTIGPSSQFSEKTLKESPGKKGKANLVLNCRNAQWVYVAIQALFWITYGLMFAFASVYLQNRSFSNSMIGLTLGCVYALSAFLQPASSRLFQYLGWETEQALRRVYGIATLLTGLLLAVPLSNAWTTILLVIVFALESAVQPCVDTLARRWTGKGCPVDFGKSRGISSLLYAGMTAGMGLLLQRIAASLIPAFYLTTMLLSVYILKKLRISGEMNHKKDAGQSAAATNPLRKPGFAFMLIGIGCIFFGHVLTDRFMLQIMQSIGGNSQHLGIAMAIASLVEFPMKLLYSRIRGKIGDYTLLVFSAWAWLAKSVLILLARTPSAIYGAEILQCCSYGLYIPASVQVIAHMFPDRENLNAQALAGSAFTVGGVIATFLGGVLLDTIGIRFTLGLITVVMAIGAVLFTFSVGKAAFSVSAEQL